MPSPDKSSKVWCVWTEWGEYEQFSRDLRGVFAREDLANAHAEQLRASNDAYDEVEVLAEDVLAEIPASVPHIEWSAHILPDGSEDRERGYKRGEAFKTWSNEITAAEGRLVPWSHRGPDLFIEVVGCDAEAVGAEYVRLLRAARETLASTGEPTTGRRSAGRSLLPWRGTRS